MNNITAIIVSYNTRDLLKACIESIRKFYPILKIIVIDGSPADSDCWQYCQTLLNNDMCATVKCLEYNCGHGPGMVKGIELCETDYFLLCDSDVEILRAWTIQAMMEAARIDLGIRNAYKKLEELPGEYFIYGVGDIQIVNESGSNSENGIYYLHPHFALINKNEYLKYDHIINHGAPMLKAMNSIQNKNSFLAKFDLSNFITHHERGTRALNPKEFNPANWDKV